MPARARVRTVQRVRVRACAWRSCNARTPLARARRECQRTILARAHANVAPLYSHRASVAPPAIDALALRRWPSCLASVSIASRQQHPQRHRFSPRARAPRHGRAALPAHHAQTGHARSPPVVAAIAGSRLVGDALAACRTRPIALRRTQSHHSILSSCERTRNARGANDDAVWN